MVYKLSILKRGPWENQKWLPAAMTAEFSDVAWLMDSCLVV
jgi:hypothetical protein